jgi:hypothetical protein
VSSHGYRKDPHLGGLVADVVDGALDHAARERALGHLARCDDCRAEVEAQRRLKARLAQLAGPEVPRSLAERLLHLPDTTAGATAVPATLDPALPPLRMVARFREPGAADLTRDAPAGDGSPFRGRGERPATPAGRSRPLGTVARPPGRTAASGRGRRRRLGAAAGGLAAFALSIATVAALGSPERAQTVVPAVDSYTAVHNRTAVGVPGADPVAQLVELAR